MTYKKTMSKTGGKLFVSQAELQLTPTLAGGQSFRWKNTEHNNWIGVFKNKVWLLSQKEDYLLFECLDKTEKETHKEINVDINASTPEDILKSYFRLDFDLNNYYKIWSDKDTYFRKAAYKLQGIRILNQEVTENIFSFICSSNNNIKRISSMVEKLCQLYGDPIVEVDGQMFYDFPTIEKLMQPTVEHDLKQAGFGYRAKFIYQSACKIKEFGGLIWLEKLKSLPYLVAKKELMKLPGVGAKVADCICLMSLGHMESVPVDTHIFQVATSIYLPHLKKYKSLTDKVYSEISDHFRFLHGPFAGWANTILFCSDLRSLYVKNCEKKNSKDGVS